MRVAARTLIAGIAALYGVAVLLPCAPGAWDSRPVMTAAEPAADAAAAKFAGYCPCQCGHEDAAATVAGEWQGPRSVAGRELDPAASLWPRRWIATLAARTLAPPDPIPIVFS